jgi:hypothetical protein
MAVKLAVLKSGENVIADVKQLVDHNDKVMSLVFTNPYVVTLMTPQILFESDTEEEYEHKVSFYPWLVLSNDKVIEVDPTWVVCVVEPNEMVKTSYETNMNKSVDGIPKETEQVIDNFEVIEEEEKNG